MIFYCKEYSRRFISFQNTKSEKNIISINKNFLFNLFISYKTKSLDLNEKLRFCNFYTQCFFLFFFFVLKLEN